MGRGARRVAVCVGKDCRRSDGHGPLVDDLDAVGVVIEVRCLDHCRGPIVVLDPDDEKPVVLERIRSQKQRRDLVAVVDEGVPLSGRLRNRRVRGSNRRAVITKLRRRLSET